MKEDSIEFTASVTEGISREVLDAFNAVPRRGAEAGGLLLGSRSGGHIQVQDFEPVLCEHRFGPSFELSEQDIAGLEETLEWFAGQTSGTLRIVGAYLSRTRGESDTTREDEEFMRRFLSPGAVLLVLKPAKTQEILQQVLLFDSGLRSAAAAGVFPRGSHLRIPLLSGTEAATRPSDNGNTGAHSLPTTAADLPSLPALQREEPRSFERGASDEPAAVSDVSAMTPPRPAERYASDWPAAEALADEDSTPATVTPMSEDPLPAEEVAWPDAVTRDLRRERIPNPPAGHNGYPELPPRSEPVTRHWPPARRPERADESPVDRRPMLVVVAAALTAILIGGILGYRSYQPTPARETSRAAQPPVTRVDPPVSAEQRKPSPVVTAEADRIQPGAAATNHDAEIRQALDVWKRAVLSGDPDRLTDCYASTVEQYFNKRNATRRDVRRTISDFLAGRGRVHVLRISDVAINSVSDGRAAATFRKHWETRGRRPFSGEERERLTFVKTDDGWKIAREEELRVYWTRRR